MKYILACIFILTVQLAAGQLIYETVWVDYDSAWEYKSLRLIPIRAKGPGGTGGPRLLSLSNAIARGVASISERGSASTENVHWLRINNRSDQPIFVASGQTFTGGRQDRMITKDTILQPTGRDQYIPVMCIEEGRWSEKEKKLVYSNYANMKLRRVLDRSKNQVLVWKEIFTQLDAGNFNAPTFAYNALRQQKAYLAQETEYMNYFNDKFKSSDSSMVGMLCVSGNRVIGCDIFAYRQMFYDELEPLLYGYVSEALMNGSEPMLTDEEIKEYTDKFLTNETLQYEFCRENGKQFRVNGQVIHLTTY